MIDQCCMFLQKAEPRPKRSHTVIRLDFLRLLQMGFYNLLCEWQKVGSLLKGRQNRFEKDPLAFLLAKLCTGLIRHLLHQQRGSLELVLLDLLWWHCCCTVQKEERMRWEIQQMRLHQLKAKRISHRQADVQMMFETESESMIHRTIEESEDTTQVHQLSMKKKQDCFKSRKPGSAQWKLFQLPAHIFAAQADRYQMILYTNEMKQKIKSRLWTLT